MCRVAGAGMKQKDGQEEMRCPREVKHKHWGLGMSWEYYMGRQSSFISLDQSSL